MRFVRAPNRNSRTLLAIVMKYCKAVSVIHTDGWKGYSSLKDHGYAHKVVIHEHNYVNPDDGTHTQKA